MPYTPQVDDYVRWVRSTGMVDEGWVYFKCDKPSTLKLVSRTNHIVNTQKLKNIKKFILICCPSFQWHELEYVKNRRNINIDEYKSQEGRYLDPQ